MYYEFYNDGDAKEMLIGFEAMSPSGDVSALPIKGHHPYISDFTVMVNNENLIYQVAKVRDSVYFQNGVFNEIANSDYELSENIQYVDFFYVYYFDCRMKKGLNIVKHTYRQELSSSVVERYSFDYILSAAGRWRGGVINDFTLILDMGEFERYSIAKSFFVSDENWHHSSNGLILERLLDDVVDWDFSWMTVIVDSVPFKFIKRDFKPEGELHISAFSVGPLYFDSKLHGTPKDFNLAELLPGPKDSFSKDVLRNLPFAYKGYNFKNIELQKYFEQQDWYVKNQGYVADLKSLSNKEQVWVLKWSD